MRHASYYDHENQYVTYFGMLKLKNSLDNLLIELNEKFSQKKIRITHSILPRAKHTALLMRDILSPKGIDVFRTSDPRLNSDKLQINEDYIKEIVGLCDKENEICIILSHQPDIELFTKKKIETSEWFRMIVELKEKPVSTNEHSDDLPF